jgi:mannosyl-oligosaccharide alpha-1,2-mannosidase
MPSLRRWGKKFENNPESSFKLLAAVLVIALYLLFKEFSHPTTVHLGTPAYGAHIQSASWQNGTARADKEKAARARDAMKYTFQNYRENAWGQDGILPLSGNVSSTNGWGAFVVDSATTLVLMGLWDELELAVQHIVAIDFTQSKELVDPFETTMRYVGGLVSLVDLHDAAAIPERTVSRESRDRILQQAVTLANSLGPAYDTATGMPWPRVDLAKAKGVGIGTGHPAITPARASSILENRALTRLTGNPIYTKNATLAWAPLVWSKWTPAYPGLVDAPLDLLTGTPVGRQRHWDEGHGAYYEYLLKMTLLAPKSDPYLDSYKSTFIHAVKSLRKSLGSRSAPAVDHVMQHLYIGRSNDKWYLNRQGHLACFAPGTILLASKFYDKPEFKTFALALLEGCHHAYTSTPSKIGPESWSWIPKFGFEDPVYLPSTAREKSEHRSTGIWSWDPRYKGRPEYFESLFYAYRITGESRFREWAWEAFSAIEKHCKAPYGYAQLADVYRVKPEEWNGDGSGRFIDVQESFWTSETLKYVWLTFADVDVANLDRWVFTTGGHPLRIMR